MKTYLKHQKHNIDLVLYDLEKLSRVCVYNELESAIEIYDDKEDFNYNITRDLQNGYYTTTEKEFKTHLDSFKKSLDSIINE